ncbi:hypothetical protein [Pectobacterium versatile]|uniref:hypothetical protein n=1 Tax=Pectobacterium versatile TaxID=2488639 RepID=UPI001CCBCC69|nr:hypothetical protein [Pectobacterium versatile]
MINRIEGGSRWGSAASSTAQHNTEASRPGGQQYVSPAMRSGSRSIDFGDASPNVPQVSTERTTTCFACGAERCRPFTHCGTQTARRSSGDQFNIPKPR